MKEKIIFVSHEASLSGAPILLLNLLTYFKDKLPYEFIIVLGRDGPIRAQLEALGRVIVYPDLLASGHFAGLLQRLRLLTTYDKAHVQQAFALKDVKLVFVNTIVNGDLVDQLTGFGVPIVTYVHELSYAIKLQNPASIQKVLQHTTLFLAGSGAVRRQLVGMGVAAGRVQVMPSSVPYDVLAAQLATIEVAEVRAELNLPAPAQVLVAVGKAGWRKGNDIFMQMATLIAARQSQVHFVWVGVSPGSLEHMHMSHDIARLGLTDRFHLIPVTPHYLRYIAAADVFVLTSREDPFPLVVLEAAVAGKPVVCFADSGGSPEFVSDANGVVVPYGNVTALADSLQALLADAAARTALGEHGRASVRQGYNIPVVADRIAQALEPYLR